VARVLVTGGTGSLGTRLLPLLVRRGHQVRSLSRHGSPDGGEGAGNGAVSYLRGDVHSGEGLATAVEGVDTVIHAATSPRLSRAVEVDGTAHVVAAAATSGAHVIYVSIVGVDSMSYAYYQAKYEAEKVVASGGAPWTIQRATQFHELIDRFLGWRVFPVTTHLAFQPIDTGDVSARLADLVDAGPSGRAEDMGGPAVVPLRQLAATRRRITGARTLLVPALRLGPLKDFDAGLHLSPDHAVGHVTWEQWIRSRPRGEWEPR
jgi:uncharacterized protein YbjT (DUF2867 family)